MQPAATDTDMTGRDERFMHAALRLGRRNIGQTGPNPSVGAILVKDHRVVGRGVTDIGGRPHAEVVALKEAGSAALGATLYVTLEPCSHVGRTDPCVDAVVAAGVSRVVVCVDDPDFRVNGQGFERLKEAGIEVVRGVLGKKGRYDLAGHLTKHNKGRPFITLKLAVSGDGFVSGPGGKPIKITCETASRYVHLMRAQHSGILVGINTVLSDDPLLTCRLAGLESRSPTRVVLDPGLRIPLTSKLIRSAEAVPLTVFTDEVEGDKVETLKLLPKVRLASFDQMPSALLEAAGTRLMIEGGAETGRRFLAAGHVDEVVIMQNQDLQIGAGVRAFPEGVFSCMEDYLQSFGMERRSVRTLGRTLVSQYFPAKS